MFSWLFFCRGDRRSSAARVVSTSSSATAPSSTAPDSPAIGRTSAIVGDRIAKVGDLSAERAATDLDVTGLYVAPGFINIHSHASRERAADGGEHAHAGRDHRDRESRWRRIDRHRRAACARQRGWPGRQRRRLHRLQRDLGRGDGTRRPPRHTRRHQSDARPRRPRPRVRRMGRLGRARLQARLLRAGGRSRARARAGGTMADEFSQSRSADAGVQVQLARWRRRDDCDRRKSRARAGRDAHEGAGPGTRNGRCPAAHDESGDRARRLHRRRRVSVPRRPDRPRRADHSRLGAGRRPRSDAAALRRSRPARAHRRRGGRGDERALRRRRRRLSAADQAAADRNHERAAGVCRRGDRAASRARQRGRDPAVREPNRIWSRFCSTRPRRSRATAARPRTPVSIRARGARFRACSAATCATSRC